MSDNHHPQNLYSTLTSFTHPRVVTMLFLGISAGIPILLIFSSLSLWLREAGVQRQTVTYFSWAALGYSFKFVWAPLVDNLSLPLLTKLLGRRRAWLFLSQVLIMISISAIALIDPAINSLTLTAWAAVFLGFSSATQDIVIDAYRIESADNALQTLMSSSYIAGYRIGMLMAGAGALFLASYFGSAKGLYSYQAWQWTYLIMAATMLIGLITTLTISEPLAQTGNKTSATIQLRFLLLFLAAVTGFVACFYFSSELINHGKKILSTVLVNQQLGGFILELWRLIFALCVAGMISRIIILSGFVEQQIVIQTYIRPIKDFFQRYGYGLAWLLLALIGLYRISDIVLGVVANVFYHDLGFSKTEIASVVKGFGLAMTITGGFLGGLLAIRFGIMRILFLGALLSALTNLLFVLLSISGHDMPMLYLVISADNLSAGLASAAFIAFLSSLINISFTAMQYAIFSSLMTMLPKILGGYSGIIVETLGYSKFFLITTMMGIPVLLLIILAEKYFQFNETLDNTD